MLKMLQKKFLKGISEGKNENPLLQLNQYPEVEKELRLLSEDTLFKVGYAVLSDAIILLRNLSASQPILESLKISNDELHFWLVRITTAIHNLPGALENRDTSYLKEEIYDAINVLYSLKGRNPELTHYIPISTPRTDSFIKFVG
ncbi:hypothetical protein [Bacillus cereus]|uniref:hypothetical protein n=1 Tax=Bacillus cereus TaxID=1396 RepID=UPI0035CAD3AC